MKGTKMGRVYLGVILGKTKRPTKSNGLHAKAA